MKAKVIKMRRPSYRSVSKMSCKKLDKSKISGLMKDISRRYKEDGIQEYINFPGFQRG